MNRPRRVTIRDVAKAAGVSVTTVSDSLSGSGRLSAATRERVVAVAESLGYKADPRARQFRRGRSGAIGLYVPDSAALLEYYMNVALGAADAAFARELAITLLPPWRDAGRLADVPLDGLILVDPVLGDPMVTGLADQGLPVVTCEPDPTPGAAHEGLVRGDNHRALDELLDHLAAQGATRIGLVGLGDDTAWGADINAAYLAWCRAHGTEPALCQVSFVGPPEERFHAADALLDDHPDIDAIVCAPEGAAISALQAAEKRGRAVPADILVASCVDHSSLRSFLPPITAIDLDPRRAGRHAVELLADLLGGARPPLSRTLPLDLVVRASTARAPS